MPDSQQPPFWGPAYHERDLDALLSGEAGNTPVALRPVESTLAALRAAPTRRELSDEAAARAAFRALARPRVWTAPPQPRVPWSAPAEHGTVTQHTLVLPPAEHLLPPPDGRPPRTARHRRRRRANWREHRSAIALASVAAVAVIVIAVAVTGTIPGSIGQLTSLGGHPSHAASGASSGRTKPSLEGTGASHPTSSPTVTGTPTPSASPSATTAPGTLCRELSERSVLQNRARWLAIFGELSKLAGGPRNVFGYCFRQLNPLSGAKGPRTYPTFPAGGYPGGPGDGGKGHSGAGNSGGGNPGTGNPFPGTGPGPGPATRAGTGQGQHGAAGLTGEPGLGLPGSPRVRAAR